MMGYPQFEIILIACIVSTACVIPGVFLVLRGMALMSDAISHAVLLGIVVSFFLIKSLSSPLLIIGAAISGVLTVFLTEVLIHTQRLKKDAAIGLVFPVFFSIGVILISKFAGQVHIDTDAVLLGELAFAPFNRLVINGVDLGPHSLWVMGVILIINVILGSLFYKELKLATFDKGLAGMLGFSPVMIHYGLMTVTSFTAVGAFDTVGSILVVALMIVPPSSAYLITDRLSMMFVFSVLVGIISAIGGYAMAYVLDASIAGSMATVLGLIFLCILFFSSRSGLVVRLFKIRRQKRVFASQMLVVQLLDHERQQNNHFEQTVSNMIDHMGWAPKFANQITRYCVQEGYILRKEEDLRLTPLGREVAKVAMIR